MVYEKLTCFNYGTELKKKIVGFIWLFPEDIVKKKWLRKRRKV